MKFKKFIAAFSAITMIATITIPAFAANKINDEIETLIKTELNDTSLSSEAKTFLKQHNIYNVEERAKSQTYSNTSEKLYVGILDKDILALKNAAEANNFTDEQIVQYVDGLLNTPSEVILESANVVRNAVSDNSISNNSRTVTDDIPRAQDRSAYDDGIGYEVQSNWGYSQATSYVTLPTRDINNLQDIAYVFYTVYVNSTCMDFGLRGGMYSWAVTYNPATADNNITISKQDGERVYFNIYVEANNLLRCRILDANNFSNVLYDGTFQMTGVAENSLCFNKQITVCNADRDFTSGSSIENAKFTGSTLYNSNGYWSMNTSNCNANRCGRFGVSGITNSYQKVTVNDYTKWASEDISIHFTNP